MGAYMCPNCTNNPKSSLTCSSPSGLLSSKSSYICPRLLQSNFFFRISKATYQRIFFRVLREQLETTKSICLRFLAVISLLFVLYEPLKMLNCKNVQSKKKKKNAKMFKNEPLLFAFNPTLLLHGSLVNSMKMPNHCRISAPSQK